jgi:hypothetical protein
MFIYFLWKQIEIAPFPSSFGFGHIFVIYDKKRKLTTSFYNRENLYYQSSFFLFQEKKCAESTEKCVSKCEWRTVTTAE